MTPLFGVWNDFGRLREVAVGTMQGATVPGWLPRFRYIAPELQEVIRRHAGAPIVEIEELAGLVPTVQRQLDNLAATYERFGVIVHRPRLLSDVERQFLSSQQVGAIQLHPADPIWIIGRHAIECQFHTPFRNKEVFPLRDLIRPLMDADPRARWVACPASAPVEGGGGAGPFLEGGDILICGNARKDVLVGIDEERSSNAAGVEWLMRYLIDDGYRVTGVPITRDGPIHLTAVLGVAGPERALVYRPSLVNGIPEQIRHWDFIDLTLDETRATGPCVVMIDPNTILVPAETPRIVDELDKRGLDVVPVEVSAISRLDGGIRCATFVIRRDP